MEEDEAVGLGTAFPFGTTVGFGVFSVFSFFFATLRKFSQVQRSGPYFPQPAHFALPIGEATERGAWSSKCCKGSKMRDAFMMLVSHGCTVDASVDSQLYGREPQYLRSKKEDSRSYLNLGHYARNLPLCRLLNTKQRSITLPLKALTNH